MAKTTTVLERITDLKRDIDGTSPEVHRLRDQLSDLVDCLQSVCVAVEWTVTELGRQSDSSGIAMAATILGIELKSRN